MRALILSDIPGNREALNAVLAAAGEWDALWNLGDMVGYGASPNQVLDVIRPLATLTVRGNHDRVCCGLSSALNFNPTARAAAKWTLAKLTPDNLEWLRALPQGPLGTEAPTAGSKAVRVTLVHGSPLNEDQYIQRPPLGRARCPRGRWRRRRPRPVPRPCGSRWCTARRSTKTSTSTPCATPGRRCSRAPPR